MDDSKIIGLYFDRNEDAIVHTRDKYGDRLFSVSRGIVGCDETARECENDTYMQAWRSIPPKAPYEYFYAYLVRIVRNISLNRAREKSSLKRGAVICELSEEMEECIPSEFNTEKRLADKELGEAINSFLASLDAQKRKIFVRRYFFCDSVADISVRYGVTQAKVKTVLFRCRKELKKQLEGKGFSI